MNRKILAALAVLALVAVAVVMRVAPPKILPDPFTSTEMAFPKLGDGDHYILAKLENPEIMQSKLAILMKMLPALYDEDLLPALDKLDEVGRNMEELLGVTDESAGREKLGEMRAALRALDEMSGYLDLAKQASALAVSGDKTGLYISFFPDGEKFDSYVKNALKENRLEKWDTDKAGSKGGAWTSSFGNNAGDQERKLFIVRTGGGDDVVLASNNEDGIDSMLEAMKNASSRMAIKRFNLGPDYLQAKVPVPVHATGNPADAFTEFAWVEDDRSAHLQIHSDVFSVMTGRSVPRSGIEGKDVPLLGRGELALVTAIDIPYACFSAFPTEEDPIGAFLSLFDNLIPSNYASDIRSIMEQGRISAVAVVDPETHEPSTAYVVIETKVQEAVSRYYALANLFMRPVELQGWDSAYSMSIGLGFDPMAARRGDMVLIGIGKSEDYAVNASIPDGIADFAAPNDLMNFVATSALFEASGSTLGRSIQKELLGSDVPASVIEALELEKLEAIQLRIMTPEKANLGLYTDRSPN